MCRTHTDTHTHRHKYVGLSSVVHCLCSAAACFLLRTGLAKRALNPLLLQADTCLCTPRQYLLRDECSQRPRRRLLQHAVQGKQVKEGLR